jgi:hypothetical protein
MFDALRVKQTLPVEEMTNSLGLSSFKRFLIIPPVVTDSLAPAARRGRSGANPQFDPKHFASFGGLEHNLALICAKRSIEKCQTHDKEPFLRWFTIK